MSNIGILVGGRHNNYNVRETISIVIEFNSGNQSNPSQQKSLPEHHQTPRPLDKPCIAAFS